jgi:MFS family permease
MFRALRHRNYRLFWIGSFLSNIGTWMQIVGQGWLVRELTPSPFLIGFVSFAGSFPQFAFALASGVYADLFDRRKLLLVTQAAQMICAAILGTLVLLRDLQLWPLLSIWPVIGVSFASGLASTLASPTYQALTLDMVGRQDLLSAVALNSMQFNFSRIVGPTIGGLMLGVAGIAGCFYFNSLSFLAVILALWLMRFPPRLALVERNGRAVMRQLLAGLRYVRGRPRVLALLSVASVTSIFGLPYLIFMPIFARDVLGLDSSGLAALWAATGVGAVASALLLAFLGDLRRARPFSPRRDAALRADDHHPRPLAELRAIIRLLDAGRRLDGEHHGHRQHAAPNAGGRPDARAGDEHVLAHLHGLGANREPTGRRSR